MTSTISLSRRRSIWGLACRTGIVIRAAGMLEQGSVIIWLCGKYDFISDLYSVIIIYDKP